MHNWNFGWETLFILDDVFEQSSIGFDYLDKGNFSASLRSPDLPSLAKQKEQTLDLGYNGIKKDFCRSKLYCGPKRKERKRFNQRLSKARVVVKHTINRIKEFQIRSSRTASRP